MALPIRMFLIYQPQNKNISYLRRNVATVLARLQTSKTDKKSGFLIAQTHQQILQKIIAANNAIQAYKTKTEILKSEDTISFRIPISILRDSSTLTIDVQQHDFITFSATRLLTLPPCTPRRSVSLLYTRRAHVGYESSQRLIISGPAAKPRYQAQKGLT